MPDILTITGDPCETCCCADPTFSFDENPIAFPDITGTAGAIAGMACSCHVWDFIYEHIYLGPSTVTTPALGAKLFCDGVEITSGVTWLITAPQHTYTGGSYVSGSIPDYPYEGSRFPNFQNQAFATDNRFGEASCYSDTSDEEIAMTDLKGDFTVNSPSSPNTTFTLSGVYGAGLGDWGGYLRVQATYLGVEYVAWVMITAHVSISRSECTP